MAKLNHNKPKGNQGQSLMELLIAIALGVIIILAGASAVAVYLRTSALDIPYQGANFLAQELMDNVTVTSEGNWFTIATATSSNYYLSTSTTGFVRNQGLETKIIGDYTYYRYFHATSTCRDINYDTVSSTLIGSACYNYNGTQVYNDPSTRKVTVTVDWDYRGTTTTVSINKFVTRTANQVFSQTDWVGGATCPSSDPTTTLTTRYCSSTVGTDTTSTPGSIKIRGF